MEDHYERGWTLFELERYREAIDEYRLELVDDPESAAAHAGIAASLLSLGDIAGAEAAIREAVSLDPDSAFIHYVRARVLECRGALAEAEEAAAEAVRLFPSAEFFCELGRLQWVQRRYVEACAALGTALQYDPHYEEALLLQSDILKDRGRVFEAQQAIRAALAANPQSAEAHSKAGQLALQHRDYEAALDFLENARQIDPVYQQNRNELAEARGRQLWPIRAIDRALRGLQAWRATRRWAYVVALATAAVLIRASNLIQSRPAEWVLAAVYTLAGYSLLVLWSPSLLDVPARVLAMLRYRQEFQYGWGQFLSDDLWQLLTIAVFFPAPVTVAALAAAAYPGVDYLAGLILIFNETMPRLPLAIRRWIVPALIPLGILLWNVPFFSRTLIITNPPAALAVWGLAVALSAIGPWGLRHLRERG